MNQIDHKPRENSKPRGGAWPDFGLIFYLLFGAALVLAGFGILGLQVYAFLQSGQWTPFAITELLALLPGNTWATSPEKWVGLHLVLSYIPTSAVLIVFGYGIVVTD